MPTTLIRASPYPSGGDAANVHEDIEAVAVALDDAPHLLRGSLASIPDPGPGRTFYEITDSGGGRLVYDNGFVWMDLVRFRSGTIGLRPTAATAGAGTVYADEYGTHWCSDGTDWLLAGGR